MVDLDYKKRADETAATWESLFDRLRNDDDLINLGQYTLLDINNQTIPHALSVTLNDIAVFVSKVETVLGDSEEKTVVTTEDENLDTSKVEKFIKAIFVEVDKKLAYQLEPPLNMSIDQQTCRRGGTAAKVILNIDPKTGELTPIIRSLDRLGLTSAVDKKGLVWASYKTKRSRHKILAEYPDIESFLDKKTEDIEVQDIWTRDHNELWVNGKEVTTSRKPNPLGYVPIVIRIVPMGSTYGLIQFWGESLLFLIRTIIPELNRLLSIAQSLNQRELDHALQLHASEADLDSSDDPPQQDTTNRPGATTKVPIGGGFDLMPLGQLTQQAFQFLQVFEARMQRGGANAFDLGTFGQTMSGIALMEVAEGREQIYLPRLNTRGLLKDGVVEMAIDQIKTSEAKNITLGGQTYKVSDLDGEYDIKHKYTSKSPAKDAARWQMAAAIGDGLSERSKLENIIEVEDVDGEIRQKKIEEAELLFVSVKKARIIRALAEEADAGSKRAEIDLKLALEELDVTLDQIMAGDIEPEQGIAREPQRPNPLGLAPLTSDGGASPVPITGGTKNG